MVDVFFLQSVLNNPIQLVQLSITEMNFASNIRRHFIFSGRLIDLKCFQIKETRIGGGIEH